MFNIKSLYPLFTLFSLLCAIVCLPYDGRAQAKAVSNAQNLLPASINLDQKAEKYTASNYKLPIGFEPNKGQFDQNVKFRGYGLGYDLFLTSNEAVMVFGKPVLSEKVDSETLQENKKTLPTTQNSVLKMKFVGANSRPSIKSSEELPGVRNYLSENQKINDVPSFKKVIYDNLYDGIGLTFHSSQQSLQYDFNIAPKIDPSTIRIKFEGADSVKIGPEGDLILLVGGEEVRHKKPVIYQDIAGIRKIVEGGYIVKDKGEIGFQLGQYDRGELLVIDPILSYSTYLGGISDEECKAIAVDMIGNVYVTGSTSSSNFPKTTNPVTTTPPAHDTNYQVFVSKFDATGQLVFSTYWGGSEEEELGDIVVDDVGNIYIAGRTRSNDYPTTPGAFQTTLSGLHNYSGFATKLNSTGTAFVYSTYIGGSLSDGAASTALDNSGNLFLGGHTWSSDFPVTPGAFQTTIPIPNYAAGFLSKLNSSGSALIYSTYLGGATIINSNVGQEVESIAIDSEGNAFVTGSSTASDFPAAGGDPPNTNNGRQDIFVSKFNNNGTALIYSKLFGGEFDDRPNDIQVDSTGNAYVAGFTESTNFPTTVGAFQRTFGGLYDPFVLKLNAAGTALIYSTYIGGNSFDQAHTLSIDASGNAFISGHTSSSNFPTTNDAFQTSGAGGFITKLNPTGSVLIYSTYWGGNSGAEINDSYLSSCGDLYVAGRVRSSDFPVRQAYQSTEGDSSSNFDDGFISKLTFLSTTGTAPDASATGSHPVTVSEYKLPAVVDTEVLDQQYNHPVDGIQPLQVELWASVYRPTTLSGVYPVIGMLHGNHGVCERNATTAPTTPPPPAGVNLSFQFLHPWYAKTGICDNPSTDTFDESLYYDVVQNHRGYDYLGQKLASWGYIVVSVNANRGIHIPNDEVPFDPDRGFILPRAHLVLRHLQKLKEWNDCTTNPSCQTPTSLGVDLRGKLDFSNVGLFGHSRGGQAVRAAYNKYKESGSVWQSRIPGLSIKGIFEIAPTDFETASGIVAQPASKFVASGTKWNVVLPICDGDVSELSGSNVYDRMLLGSSGSPVDSPATQKSTYAVWGANHNFYNTTWTKTDGLCFNHDSIFNPSSTGSEQQRQTALTSATAFFRGNIGSSTTPNFNQNFNPKFDPPATIQTITRAEQNFTPSPHSSSTTVFEDFNTTTSSACSSGTNTCTIAGSPVVSHTVTKIPSYHDESLNVLRLNWSASGSDKSIQVNWRPAGTGASISDHDTFDFRISRTHDGTNLSNSVNFSIQLVMANGAFSSPVKLCNYATLDRSVGGQVPVNGPRPLLQTVRVPLSAFTGADLSQIRGVKITFDESSLGSIFLANLRFTK